MAAGPPPSFPLGPSPVPFTDEDVKQNIANQLQRFADQLNITVYTAYAYKMKGVQTSVDAGREYPEAIPEPPNKYIVEDGQIVLGPRFSSIIIKQPDFLQSGTGVAATNSTLPQNPDIGADLGGGWFAAGPHDTTKSGTVIDTPLGKLRKVGAPVGNGWYQRV